MRKTFLSRKHETKTKFQVEGFILRLTTNTDRQLSCWTLLSKLHLNVIFHLFIGLQNGIFTQNTEKFLLPLFYSHVQRISQTSGFIKVTTHVVTLKVRGTWDFLFEMNETVWDISVSVAGSIRDVT